MIKRLTILWFTSGLATCISCGGTDQSANAVDIDAVAPGTPGAGLTVTPVSHASFVLTEGDHVIFNDPVGGAAAYANFGEPDIILISDIHGDHADTATIAGLMAEGTELIVPQAVADMLSPKLAARARIVANGEKVAVDGIEIDALPMYNLREEALQFHTKGRGNGYVVTLAGERVYIAGDTEDIPEMRALKDIDWAFVPMNLPYTMPVDAAADAVIEFAPARVYPYHYRGTDGYSDTAQFRKLVEASGKSIKVVGLNWYPEATD